MILVQRIVVGDTLTEQQSSNAVRVPNALPQQRGALARDPAAVLLIRGWRHCHRADPRLAPLPGHQRAQQRLAVDGIGLGAPVASRRRLISLRISRGRSYSRRQARSRQLGALPSTVSTINFSGSRILPSNSREDAIRLVGLLGVPACRHANTFSGLTAAYGPR
jgi:hypothetical protein